MAADGWLRRMAEFATGFAGTDAAQILSSRNHDPSEGQAMTQKHTRELTRAGRGLVAAAVAALALTTIVPQDAFARAPVSGAPAQAKAVGDLTELSAAGKQRRRVVRRGMRGHRAAAAMFGMMAGTIATIAAAEARRSRSYYYVPDYYVPDYPVYEEAPVPYYPSYENGYYPYYEPYYDNGPAVYGGPTYYPVPVPMYGGGGVPVHRPRHIVRHHRFQDGVGPVIGRPGPVFRHGAPVRIGGGGAVGPKPGPGGGVPRHMR
jgi:hypothetical protein